MIPNVCYSFTYKSAALLKCQEDFRFYKSKQQDKGEPCVKTINNFYDGNLKDLEDDEKETIRVSFDKVVRKYPQDGGRQVISVGRMGDALDVGHRFRILDGTEIERISEFLTFKKQVQQLDWLTLQDVELAFRFQKTYGQQTY